MYLYINYVNFCKNTLKYGEFYKNIFRVFMINYLFIKIHLIGYNRVINSPFIPNDLRKIR